VKKGIITLVVFAACLMAALSFITARYIDREEIARTRLKAERMRAVRDSITTVAAFRDSLQHLILDNVHLKETVIAGLRQQVQTLEAQRTDEQLNVRYLDTREELEQQIMRTFPELGDSVWRVTEIYFPEEDESMEYLSVPLWFSETFIIDHQNADNLGRQVDKLRQMDSLQTVVTVLKDSLYVLEHQNRTAMQTGYEMAYAEFDTLQQKYIRLLEKPPQINFGLPQWGAVAGGTAAGIFIGTQIQKR